MQFDEVLRTFKEFFERERIRYALIGGLAMQAWGYSRGTRDADFAVHIDARERVIAFAESLDYETLFSSASYSNHLHASPEFGRVDFMYVAGETAEKLLSSVIARPIVGDIHLPVARPEFLAAMKATAMKNRPHRVLIDADDVSYLLKLPDTNREEVRDYFARIGMLDLYDAIKRHS